MVTVYEIIHVRPDKERTVMQTVTDPAEIPLFVETAQYAGTWLSDTRKLLRYGRGEIVIEVRNKPMEIAHHAYITEGQSVSCLLRIKNSEAIGWFETTAYEIIAYDHSRQELWRVDSFKEMTDMLGHDQKEIVYGCMKYYEQLVDGYNLEGAL